MDRGWKFVLIAVVAIVALGAMFALGRSEFGRKLSFRSTDVGNSSGSTSDAGPSGATIQASQHKARLQGRAVVLPPANIPAAEAIAQLKDAADHGSPRAACRVALELGRCRAAEQALNAAQFLSEDEGKRTQELVKRILDSTDADAARCTGIPSALYSQTYRYQTIAAQGGNPAMQRWLMQKPALISTDFISHLDEWADYKRRVGEYAPVAVHRKQFDDLSFLVRTYAPSLKFRGDASVPINDDVTFLALMDAARDNDMELSADLLRSEAVARNSLSGDERLRYEALSSELSGKWETSPSSEAAVAGVGISGSVCEQVAN